VPDALVVVMTEYHYDRDLQLHACEALHKLASYSEANNAALSIADACRAVVDVIAQDSSDAQVCMSAITAVCALAENSVNKSMLRFANAADTIQIVLDRHSSSDNGALVQMAQSALQLLQLHSTAPKTANSSDTNSTSAPSYSARQQPCAPPLSPEGKPTANCYQIQQCMRCSCIVTVRHSRTIID
jgi:hypothetical protein